MSTFFKKKQTNEPVFLPVVGHWSGIRSDLLLKKKRPKADKYDLKVWFHSCGQFRPVMGDLIDIGLDVWETVQTHLSGNEPEILKREYGDHITFFGGISTQTTLPFGSTDDVRREVRERIRVLGKNGGYICGPDHGIMPDVPLENVLAMYNEARKFKF
jgi:uroporphyrinogen decarboxylase